MRLERNWKELLFKKLKLENLVRVFNEEGVDEFCLSTLVLPRLPTCPNGLGVEHPLPFSSILGACRTESLGRLSVQRSAGRELLLAETVRQRVLLHRDHGC